MRDATWQSTEPSDPTILLPVHKTLKGVGRPIFRSSAAYDLHCLMELDVEIVHWRCDAPKLEVGKRGHKPDFHIFYRDGDQGFADAHDRNGRVDAARMVQASLEIGTAYRLFRTEEVTGGFRLRNAKDLLRYKTWNVPLSERVRLLAALEIEGSMPLGDCLNTIGHRNAVPFVAALACQQFIEVEMDDAPIGPDTSVRRRRI